MSSPRDSGDLKRRFDQIGSNGTKTEEGAAKPPPKKRTRWGQKPEGFSDTGGSTSSSSSSSSSATDGGVPPTLLSIAGRAEAARAALEKAKKALAMRKQVNEQLQALKGTAAMATVASVAPFSSLANEAVPAVVPGGGSRSDRLTEAGKLMPLKPLVHSTLKVNRNREREERLKQVFQMRKSDRSLTDPQKNPWFDPAIGVTKPKKKGLRFIEEGFYTKKEQQMFSRAANKALGLDYRQIQEEKRAALERMEEELKFREKFGGGGGGGDADTGGFNPNLIPLGGGVADDDDADESSGPRRMTLTALQRQIRDMTPEVEIWDMPILTKNVDMKMSSDEAMGQRIDPRDFAEAPREDSLTSVRFPYRLNLKAITKYIEHPVAIPPANISKQPLVVQMILTPKERAKLRRRRRQEKEREKQDKIRMGLIDPPPPKVRLANLMRVLGDQAVADPSRIEKRARAEMAQRIQDHEARNEARRLTGEARSNKRADKWRVVAPGQLVEVLVFSVKELTSRQHVFKVDRNAQQYHLTGVGIICPGVGNVVIVEGSHRATKGFRKLMLRRVDWTPSEQKDDEEDEDEEDGDEIRQSRDADAFCKLIWQGSVKERSFKQWKVHVMKGESEARKLLADRHAEHYWDMAVKKFRDAALDL